MIALLVAAVVVIVMAVAVAWRRWSHLLRVSRSGPGRTATALQVLGRLTREAPRTASGPEADRIAEAPPVPRPTLPRSRPPAVELLPRASSSAPAPEHRWVAPPPAPPPAPPAPRHPGTDAPPMLVFDDCGPGTDLPAPAPEGGSAAESERRVRPRVALIAAGCAVLLAGGVVTGVAAAGSDGGHSRSSGAPAAGSGSGSGASTGPQAAAPAVPTTTSPPPTSAAPPTTAPALVARPGGPPVLASMSPAAGVTGQSVTLTGAGLFSSDGLITVRFGTAIASTVCPDENTCQVKVPVLTSQPGGPTPVTVTVTTDTGTSNGLAFRYG